MLTSVKIGNFKAFGDVQRIPLRPLTLVYGANSSGKSSILHALIIARHALETGELDVHRTAVGGDSVDLGGFRQFIHQRHLDHRLTWCAELDTTTFTKRLAEYFASLKTVGISVEIGLAQEEEFTEKEGIDPRTGKPVWMKIPTGRVRPTGAPQVMSYSLNSNGSSLLQMSKRPDGRLKLDRIDQQHPVFRGILQAIVETSTTTEAIQVPDYEGIDSAIAEMVTEIAAAPGKFLPEGIEKTGSSTTAEGQQQLFPVSSGNRREDLSQAVRFFLPRTLHEMIQGVSQAVASDLMQLQYLGPLRSYPPRHLAFSQHHDPNWFAGGGYAWDVVRRNARVRKLVNAWLSAPDRLQTPYELVLRDLVGIDQIEGPLLDGLERLSDDGLDINHEIDEDGIGNSWPVIRDPESEAVKLRDLIRSSDIDKMTELIMVDTRGNTVVSHRDVGIGVSQVLPVLVGAYATQRQLIAIEQPEIHLHPALQADLGDVFIESALGENRNRFLIETHSEHLLLRIMRRMRQTHERTLDQGFPDVRPEDVCVLFVEPDGSRSIIREMPLNERGELVKAWPGGFFEEGLREVF